MALHFEMRQRGQWATLGTLHPGDRDGSLSHNGPAGRQIYSFGCYGDHSIIRRSRAGADFEIGALRAVDPWRGFEEVARLSAQNPSLEFYLKTDNMRAPQRVRFRHD